MTALSGLRSGFLTSLLNPKVKIFFLALFARVISPDTPLLAKGVYGLAFARTET